MVCISDYYFFVKTKASVKPWRATAASQIKNDACIQ